VVVGRDDRPAGPDRQLNGEAIAFVVAGADRTSERSPVTGFR
jgi:hypothetical protein